MNRIEDPFFVVSAETLAEDFADREGLPEFGSLPASKVETTPAVGRLLGFDIHEQPQVAHLAGRPGEVLTARTTVPLRRALIGREVVVLFDGGDVQAPVIMGVIEPVALLEQVPLGEPGFTIKADNERYVVTAEREIVLSCGDASITLTRAGKVIIQGNYILSRSRGYNKIKGAAIDIN